MQRWSMPFGESAGSSEVAQAGSSASSTPAASKRKTRTSDATGRATRARKQAKQETKDADQEAVELARAARILNYANSAGASNTTSIESPSSRNTYTGSRGASSPHNDSSATRAHGYSELAPNQSPAKSSIDSEATAESPRYQYTYPEPEAPAAPPSFAPPLANMMPSTVPQQVEPSTAMTAPQANSVASLVTPDDAVGDGRKAKRELSQSKRAAQNRAAQRAFRQRKEGYIKALEQQVADFKAKDGSFKTLQAENQALREYVIHLQSRLLDSHGAYPEPPPNLNLGPTNHHGSLPLVGGASSATSQANDATGPASSGGSAASASGGAAPGTTLPPIAVATSRAVVVAGEAPIKNLRESAAPSPPPPSAPLFIKEDHRSDGAAQYYRHQNSAYASSASTASNNAPLSVRA